MSAYGPDKNFDEPAWPDRDPDERPAPAKLRGYWGDPADRPPRPVWDPSAVVAEMTDEPAFPPSTPSTPAYRASRHIPQPSVDPLPVADGARSIEATLGDHVLAILLSFLCGAFAAGVSALYLRRPGTSRGEASATWFLAPDPLKLAIALLILGSVFLVLGILVGKAAPRAWGWSALVAWGPLALWVFNAFALMPGDLAAFQQLPDISRRLLGLGGAQLLLVAAALLGGYAGSRDGGGGAEAGDPVDDEPVSDRLPIGHRGHP